MAPIPSRITDRLSQGVKRFKPILASAKTRDVGESDTVTIVVQMLTEVFGYDQFLDITSEHAIKSTFCDLAIKVEDEIHMLIEVKAIGTSLKDQHVRQSVDYATRHGIDWAVVTNGMHWRIYKVTFSKPIEEELLVSLDFEVINHKSDRDIQSLFLLCKEGWKKTVLGNYHTQKEALSRFCIGAMVLSDPVVDVIRRELKRISPDVRIGSEEIRFVLTEDVLKREVLEGNKADDARKKVAKSLTKKLRDTEKSAPKEAEDPLPNSVNQPQQEQSKASQ